MLDQVDFPFLEALREEWADRPPLRWLGAAYFGIKPKEKSKPGNFDDLLAMFPRASDGALH